MFQSRKSTILFTLALLIVSAALLGGCRSGSGISPTYTPPPPTVAPTLSPLAPPTQVIDSFVQIYGIQIHGAPPPDDSMKGINELFDRAYAKVGAMPIVCAMKSSRSSYGPFNSYTIDSTAISDTVALVRATMVAPVSTVTVSFNLVKEAGLGWRIDSILGWIGGDITPQNPVGASQSCLTSLFDEG